MSDVNLLLAKKCKEKGSQHPALTDRRNSGNCAALLNFPGLDLFVSELFPDHKIAGCAEGFALPMVLLASASSHK